MSFHSDYKRGLDAIYLYAPYFYKIMLHLGIPVANENIPTAQVNFNPHTKEILFEINPNLIESMTDEEVGFVIAHEAYHVLLNHLPELMMKEEYPQSETLVLAHEYISNDNVANVLGLDIPDTDFEIYLGKNIDQDFSMMSTREAYDVLAKDEEKTEDDSVEQDDEKQNNSSSNSSSNGSDNSAADVSDKKSESPSGNNDQQDDEKSSEDEDSSAGYDSEGQDEDSDADSQPGDKVSYCAGPKISEENYDEFMKSIVDAVEKSYYDMKSNDELDDVPVEMQNIMSDYSKDVSFGIGNDRSTMFMNTVDDNMNLDWKSLIAEINPKILSAGGPKKYKDVWHQPRRRMISSYPKVVLPARVEKKDGDDKGDEIPTFILALDWSVSIPDYLIAGLANLADTVPDKFVKVLPITWSNHYKEFDTVKRNMIIRGGTNIGAVYEYSQKVAKEIGRQPYVFVITDGQFHFKHYETNSKKNIQDYWYWGGINKGSERIMNPSSGQNSLYFDKSYTSADRVFNVNDFLA